MELAGASPLLRGHSDCSHFLTCTHGAHSAHKWHLPMYCDGYFQCWVSPQMAMARLLLVFAFELPVLARVSLPIALS